ncbi:hypothetical protein C6P46_004893 [Rhodotorula mucilaginosa]|uniref:Uncharacterized protein n=1 Tax=Rhodotorula mucilaginosa TaxID=5537 RepID=A0A9P6W9Y8_RHOMI|nr:hypothetical protein C6P46_004893 [Rhodotorula mucilaginosa]
MTRPIPVTGQRQRRSKSCCKGLSEEFLHALDQEDSEWLTSMYPGGPATYPRCERCDKNGIDCTFAPSKRKGRPRRLPAAAAQSSGGEQQHATDDRPEKTRQNSSDSGASSLEEQPYSSTGTARAAAVTGRVNRRHEQRRKAEQQPYLVSSSSTTSGRLSSPEDAEQRQPPLPFVPPLPPPAAVPSLDRSSSSPLSSSSPRTPALTTMAGMAPSLSSVSPPVASHPLQPPVGLYGQPYYPTVAPAYNHQEGYFPTATTGSLTPPTPGGGIGSASYAAYAPHQQQQQQQQQQAPVILSPLSSNGSLSRPSPPSAPSFGSSDEHLSGSGIGSEKLGQQQPPPYYLGHLHALAARFLDEAYEWVPFLPSTHGGLVSHLACSRPILTEALECLLDPLEKPCPCVDLTEPGAGAAADGLTSPSLADLQAAAILSVLAFAQRERQRSIDLLQYACRHMLARGWNGERTVLDDPVFSRSGLEDVDQLMDLGWYLWGIEVQLGIITGQRASILSPRVPPPSELNQATARKYSFHVAFLATDYAHLWSLETDQARCAYLRKVLTLVHDVHNVCVDALKEAKFPPYPVQLNAVVDRAKRQDWILGGMLALAGGILILSSASPLSPYVAPALPCSLDTTSRPAPNSRHLYAIASSAKGIVRLVKEFGTNSVTTAAKSSSSSSNGGGSGGGDEDEPMQMYAWPETIHHPFFGCCLVVAARGLLILSEDLQADAAAAVSSPPSDHTAADNAINWPPPTTARAHSWLSNTSADPHLELEKISRDLDLCEGFLRVQAQRWKASEMLANEVGLLRRTAGFA